MKKWLMTKFLKNALSVELQKSIIGGGAECGWTGQGQQYCAGTCSVQISSDCRPAGPAVVCSTGDFSPVCDVD